jgi:hypothetical protein
LSNDHVMDVVACGMNAGAIERCGR